MPKPSESSGGSHPSSGSRWSRPGPDPAARRARSRPPGRYRVRSRRCLRWRRAYPPAAAACTPRPWPGRSNRRCTAPPRQHPERGRGTPLRSGWGWARRVVPRRRRRTRNRQRPAASPARRPAARPRCACPARAGCGRRSTRREYRSGSSGWRPSARGSGPPGPGRYRPRR